MLVVRVELWPFGYEEEKKELAVGTIVNDGTGTMLKGNYEIHLSNDGGTDPFDLREGENLWRQGRVEDHVKYTSPTVWSLVKAALNEVTEDAEG